jgi:hypothetical protein
MPQDITMNTPRSSNAKARFGRTLSCLLALAVAGAAAAQSAIPDPSPPALTAQQPVPHKSHRTSIEERTQGLVHGLNLDAAQEVAVRAALASQRENIRKLMSEPAPPGVSRMQAVAALNAAAIERIRLVLSDEQKKKYIQPLQHDGAHDDSKLDVEQWMKAMPPKPNQAP